MEKSSNDAFFEKEKSLEEIFLEIGFNSHSTFLAKPSKKHFGISPAAFRKKIRQKILRKFKPLSAISDKKKSFSSNIFTN